MSCSVGLEKLELQYMIFKWIGGATWTLEIDGVKIACDPVLCPRGTVQNYRFFSSTRLNDPVYDESTFKDIDIWLITHTHEDHLDTPGKAVITSGRVFSNQPLPELSHQDITTVEWQETQDFRIRDTRIRITAMPAYHARTRFLGNLVGNGNGYFLEIDKKNGERHTILVTGDAVFDAGSVQELAGRVDVVITNAGQATLGNNLLSMLLGRITNNKQDIQNIAKVLKPTVILPVHWGTFSHYSENLSPDDFHEQNYVRLLEAGDRIKVL